MSLVFLSINLCALVNCIQLFHSELVQLRGKVKVLNKGEKSLHGRRRKRRWRKHPDHGVPVTSGPLKVREEQESVSEVKGLLIM